MIIAEGILTWHADERRSGRYGSVEMLDEDGKFLTLDVGLVEGEHGRLFAEVVETRRSHHVGDFSREIGPSTPEVGDVIELGAGTLFVESPGGSADQVGLRPDDDRDSDWLDPRALYRLHSQTVKLQFEPTEKEN